MMKACCSQMVTRLLLVGSIFLLSPVFSHAARPQTVNLVQNLLLTQSKNQTSLVVQGTRTPVFSSFRLHNPPRLVIDLSNVDLRSLASSMHYRVGLVRHIGVQQFSNSTTRMGRLVLHLKGATEWTLKRKGTRLVVTLSGNSATGRATTSTNTVPATIRPMARTRSRGPVVRRSGVLSGPQGRRGFRLRRVFAGRGRLSFGLSGVVGQYEVLQLRNPSRLVVDLYRVRKAFRGDVQVSCDTHGLSSLRFGRHKRKLRIVLDSCSKRPFLSFKAVAARRGLNVQFAVKAKTTTGQILQPLAAATRSRIEVKHIGLSETTTASVLMIRTNSRHPVARVIQTASGYTLRLQAAVLPSRLSQKMDTSDFRGVIREIKPVQRGSFVEIQVKSSQNVPTQLRRKGEVLLWSFLIPRKNLVVANTQKKSKGSYRISFHPKKVGQATLKPPPGRLAGGVLSNRQVMSSLASSSSQRKYTGRRISLYFQKVEAHNLLNLFAELSGFNIIISQSVQGRVTLKLRNVPWDQALALVMKTLKLGMERDGNVIRIAPLAQLQAERVQRRKMEQLKLMTPPMKIRLIPVNYANASGMAGKVRTVLSPKGKISIDSRTNVLIVQDYVPFLIRAEGLVRSLDTQTPQVLIEARIVEANVNFDQQFGIQWGGHLLFGPLTGTSTGLVFPNPVGVRGGVSQAAGGAAGGGGAQGGAQGFGSPNYVINFPASAGTGRGTALDFLFGSLSGIASVSLRLSMAESKGYVKIISSPKIITLHKQSASISQGVQIPFSSASAAGTNVQFVSANLSLSVTPQVTSDGSVFLKMNVTNNAPDFSKAGASGPSISTKSATTNMLIKDGETMVIGGIYSRRTGGAQARVPFLSSIPILGALFRNYQFNDDRAELLVFVTPRIINRAQTMSGRKSN